MPDGEGGFPDVVVQHLLQVDVIVLVQTKRISHNVCNFHPAIDQDYLHNLKKCMVIN